MKISKRPYFLILSSLIFVLVSFYLACERDFSAINKNPNPPPANGPDTTSHNFTWQIDTFGVDGRGSSYLLDVAIVNENDLSASGGSQAGIWAVGEIHTAETDTFDSLGNWVPPYNIARWNGNEWELLRTEAPGFGFGTNYSIFAFSASDIWVGSGIPKHWNGIRWTFYGSGSGYPGGFRINGIWGTSSSNLYFVGNGGNIVYYDGNTWQELNSGTDIDIQDIWGAQNPQTGEYEILAVASQLNLPPLAKQLLQIHNTTVTILPDSGLPLGLQGIWFVPNKKYYITGDGVYYNTEIGQSWEHDTDHPHAFKHAIRGRNESDIMIVGSFGLLSHFNGSTWHHYSDDEIPGPQGLYVSVNIKGNLVVAVGIVGGEQAIILRGVRD
ncbi:MAG: hypothetical protein GWN00_07920 [Aliifodinibius sp.]|nr:hypothetical protein [candidate division Zixibacteria bacterium]NIT56152.1 hypothetical protein [Fodinibius sp.]NIV05506.1 hypothetical protein [candidate division Zixibacteria bacterium]NIY24735.1 hypothetical protein [Fodinibius sp.]